MKRITNIIVWSTIMLLYGCFSPDAHSGESCRDFEAYRTLEKTFSGFPLIITVHRRVTDDYQCVSALYKDNTTVIDKSIRSPFGLNMMLGKNIVESPLLIVASSMGDEPDSGYEVTLYDVESSKKLIFSESISMPLYGDINNDSIDDLVFFNNNLALDSVSSVELGWPVVLKLTAPLMLESIESYPVLITRLKESSKVWLKKLLDVCPDYKDPDSSCTAVEDSKKIRTQLDYLDSIRIVIKEDR